MRLHSYWPLTFHSSNTLTGTVANAVLLVIASDAYGLGGYGCHEGFASMNARILLADHHVMFRECLCHGLDHQPDMSVVGEISDASQLLPMAREITPDVIVIEVQMPGAPLSVVRDLRKFVPAAQVIFLTDSVADGLIQENLRCGACGYVLKQYPMAILAEAIRCVFGGKQYFVSEVQQRMLGWSNSDGAEAETALSKISPRELIVLRLLAEGRSVKQVAYDLQVSYKTVDNQTSSVMRKLDIHSRADLVRYAIREQLATV